MLNVLKGNARLNFSSLKNDQSMTNVEVGAISLTIHLIVNNQKYCLT